MSNAPVLEPTDTNAGERWNAVNAVRVHVALMDVLAACFRVVITGLVALWAVKSTHKNN